MVKSLSLIFFFLLSDLNLIFNPVFTILTIVLGKNKNVVCFVSFVTSVAE